MDIWNSNIVKSIRGVFGSKPAAAAEPKPDALKVAHETVERATARISNAYGNAATTFAVHYRGRDLLITSAHHTTNYHDASRGFTVGGKQYFLITKGNGIALAEHLSFNPQGGPCAIKPGQFSAEKPYSDISILQLVPPEKTAGILYDMQFDNDTRARINRSLTGVKGFKNPLAEGLVNKEVLQESSGHFVLRALPIKLSDQKTEMFRTPSSYSLGYYTNAPEFTPSKANNDEISLHGIRLAIDPRLPVVKGHSGGPTYDVNERGTIAILGVVTGVDSGCSIARATNFKEVLRGMDRIIANNLIIKADLSKICVSQPGESNWFSPDFVKKGHIPAPITTPPKPSCTRTRA